MKISGEFLVIEGNKAVIKTLEKQIIKYDCLTDCIEKIDVLDEASIKDRVACLKYSEIVVFSDVFKQEIEELKIDDSINISEKFSSFWLPYHTKNELKVEFNDYKEQNKLTLSQLSSELQNLICSELKNDAKGIFKDLYDKFYKVEKKEFIQETLKENFVAFCKDYNPEGWKGYSFKYKNIYIYRGSNLGFGSLTYDYINVEIDAIEKIYGVYDENFHSFSINHKDGYTIDKVGVILNEYLEIPTEFKKELIKNNIRHLKTLLLKEEETLHKIEDVVIPELEEKIENLKKKSEKRKKIKIKLKKYKKEEERYGDFTYKSEAYTISERKKRIELLKIEINNLIKLYKSEEDLLDYV